jgi:hypothetical protein
MLVVMSVASVGVLLSACTSTNNTGSASPNPTASSPSATATSSALDANAVTINITIKNKQVTPNGEKINISKGQTVIENVVSDADDEVHAHTSGNGYELEVKAGVPVTGRFVATDTGSFEIESHHLNKIIAILVVR